MDNDHIVRNGRSYRYDADFDVYRAAPEPVDPAQRILAALVLLILTIVAVAIYFSPHYPR
jgi:hypothetical protein